MLPNLSEPSFFSYKIGVIIRIKRDYVYKGVTVCCQTHGRGQNGGGSCDNPGIMVSHISVSSGLTHLHVFSMDRASRVQNFTWIPLPDIPKVTQFRGLISGIGSMGSAPTAKVTKRLGQRKVIHFICCIFYYRHP